MSPTACPLRPTGVWIACVLTLPLLPACGGGGTSGSGDGTDSSTSASTSGTGGSTDDVVCTIPAGAHPSVTEATVMELDASQFPTPQDLDSAVYDIGPTGTQFAFPITIGIPLKDDTNDVGPVLDVVRYDEANDVWEVLPGSTLVGTTVFAKTDHFSVFALLGHANAESCDNVWGGGPADVAPLYVPGSITVAGATLDSEDIQYSAEEPMALGSTWTTNSCSVVVSGNFGPGLTGDGAWRDFTNPGNDAPIPQIGGAFSFTVSNPAGPPLGLANPCHAALGTMVYDLNINIAADCVDLCAGVTCTDDDGNPCTADTCNAQTGLCEQAPATATCGSSNAGNCVQGYCMLEVNALNGPNGETSCAAEGLTCSGIPELVPRAEACLAFHPTATVTSSGSGWNETIYCDVNSEGPACQSKLDNCHDCPACTPLASPCLASGSTQAESFFVSCI